MFGLVSKAKYNKAIGQLNLANKTISKLQTRTAKSDLKTDEPLANDREGQDKAVNAEVKKTSARSTASAIRREKALEMSATGMNSQEIASNLGVKESTVETYLREGKNANKGQN